MAAVRTRATAEGIVWRLRGLQSGAAGLANPSSGLVGRADEHADHGPRGDARAIRNYIDYACYVAMFPQLVAGPIVRASHLIPQFKKVPEMTRELDAEGAVRIVVVTDEPEKYDAGEVKARLAPGVTVHHVHAGPFEGLAKGELPGQPHAPERGA